MAKHLEKGRFARPAAMDKASASIPLRPEALEMLLSGIDLKDGMSRAWQEERK